MEHMKFCQSCSMPLSKKEDHGTNADGTPNEDYCAYCYKDGAFIADCTMDQMIEFCVAPMADAHPEMSEAEARERLNAFFPTLKRWK